MALKMGIEQRILIQRPVEEVFLIASNPANLPHFDDNIVEVKPITNGEIGMGMTCKLVAVQFGKQMTVDLEITAYELNHHFSFRVNGGPFQVETHYTFVSEDHTTQITGKREPQPDGVWNMIMPLISIPARIKFENELRNLKIFLESLSS